MKYRYTNFARKAFTLIELLVVIAIIGILSAVVLASLNQARSKGADATIFEAMNTVRVQAENQFDNLGATYNSGAAISAAGTGCSSLSTAGTVFTDTRLQNALKSVAAANKAGAATNLDCGVTGTAYSFAVALTASANTFYCMDNTGYSNSRSKAYNASYTALTGACTSAGVCAAHAAAGSTVCQ